MNDHIATAERTAEVTAGQVSDDEITAGEQPDTEVISQDMLVEEVSIDGMCGVY